MQWFKVNRIIVLVFKFLEMVLFKCNWKRQMIELNGWTFSLPSTGFIMKNFYLNSNQNSPNTNKINGKTRKAKENFMRKLQTLKIYDTNFNGTFICNREIKLFLYEWIKYHWKLCSHKIISHSLQIFDAVKVYTFFL